VTSWSEAYLDRLVAAFEDARDPDRAPAMSAYMRNQFPFLGLGSQRWRELVRQARQGAGRPTQQDVTDLVLALWERPEREYQYAGAAEVRRHAPGATPAFLPVVERLITTKSWWDTVDVLAVHGAGVLVANEPGTRAEMDRWLASEDLWLRRSALLHQLLWRDRTDAGWLFAACLRLAGERDFFIRKAIGWSLREFSKTDRAAVTSFVEANAGVLSPLSRREALAWMATHPG
jgi:3-methyladenine DNA glycosylase AlkD